MRARLAMVFMVSGLVSAGPALAANGCHGDFSSWLAGVKQEALAQGISARAVDEGLDGLTPDPSVVRRDHGQGVFRQSFEQFSQRMVPPRLGRARSLEQRYAPMFKNIEARYGVSPPVLLAIWGLETDFGSTSGNFSMIRSIATLAYDCRRSDMFKAELFDSLRMVQRGAASGSSRSAWAGEIGQTQFMPSTYLKSAVSLSGGAPDLNHSVGDVLASTAHFLQQHGWQRGAGWAPGEPNFAAIQEWNKSRVYSRTIAYFATRLAGTSEAGYKDDGGDDAPAPKRASRRQRDDAMDLDQGGGDSGGYTAPRRPRVIDPLDEQ